ncbi:MAG TPA: acetylxylan esterase [Solirubrobacterales bacterium]|nr:acetylxylan esterase [Solirubrobacterales bacterium]
MRKIAIIVSIFSALTFATNAGAAIPDVFDGAVECEVQTAPLLPGQPSYEGQRWCGTGGTSPLARSTVKTFDGVPIDVNVAFPEAPESGPDGPYPLVMVFHGYGQSKIAFAGMQRWLRKGYAVFSMTDRGFHESCGTPPSRLADPAGCADGYVRLLDTRYEVRDAQLFAGVLADENLIVPNKLAATGMSYGGGLSMALAALRNRTMMPDGRLVPWTSPDGKPMELAVATPGIPWTDLAYSLVPNGSTIDYLKDSPYFGRFGVMKESWVNLLYLVGPTAGLATYAAPGQDPAADLTGWKALLDAGEPYDGRPEAQAILDEITANHSSYYIDHSIPPAPMLISSGFTDDLFPVDEATRFYNRSRAQYPNNPIGLFFGPNSGHMRGMSKADATAAQQELEDRWVDHYLAGAGSKPESNVTTLLQTCPAGAPIGPAHVAADWASMTPGEIRVTETNQVQTVGAQSGDPVNGGLFNPAPTGQACAAGSGGEEPGSASWETPPAPAGGYTILGAPTVVAGIEQAGIDSQIAARLVDVSPDGLTKTLIARGLWRPAPSGTQVFQLHANGWKVEEGHVARLELLAKDGLGAGLVANYGRPSDGQTEARISNMDLRIPVRETPGSLGGLVTKPAPKVLPNRPGAALAPGYESIGSVPVEEYKPPRRARLSVIGAIKVKGKRAKVKVRCPKGATGCPGTALAVRGAAKGRGAKGKGVLIAAGRGFRVSPGKTKTVSLKLTRRGRTLFGAGRGRGIKRSRAKVTIRSGGLKTVIVIRSVIRVGSVR